MRQLGYGLLTAFIATTFISNVYAVLEGDEMKALKGSLLSNEVVNLLKDAGEIMDTCTMQIKFEIISDSCIKFITDMRDSLKIIVDNTNVTLTDSDFNKLMQSITKPESGIKSYP
jgi:hypothetical protein